MKRRLLQLLLCGSLLTFSGVAYGQPSPTPSGDTVSFRFVPGKNEFYSPYRGNGAGLDSLYALIDRYHIQIKSGEMPVYVDGYCASLGTERENRQIAFIRSNRVKSEMITKKGLVEANFRTKNQTVAYTDPSGTTYKDMVVVSFRLPAPPIVPPTVVEEPAVEVAPGPTPAPQARPVPEPVVVPEPVDPWRDRYAVSVRTNLLYDAFLMPTLGIEWRINRHIGIKLDGSLSWWGDEKGKVQKVWGLSPEVRWYLGGTKRFYLGAGGNYTEYNVYKYPIGGVLSSETGYQGTLWNAGLTVGYQLRLARSWSLDFNLGLGYNHSNYDSFSLAAREGWNDDQDFPRREGVRVLKDRNKTKTFWGPTQAGVTLVWRIGKAN